MKSDIDILKIGQDLIDEQLDALTALKNRLNDNFIKIVELMSNCRGRIIIIGLGKSGIIGRKISATLNSTGTFSSFIHASDALHGDLGNINYQDIVLFLSKSGNTDEVKKIIPLVKRMKVKIIGMTGNIESYLALNADFILDVSISKEACPNNLAPTTSTTMQLVMGDALSISLLKLNKFSTEDFAKLHPGGALGRKLNLTISDVTDFSNKPVVDIDDKIEKIIMEISSKRLGATAVINNKTIVGIITDGDLRRMLEKKDPIQNLVARDCMTKNPKTIDQGGLLYEAFSVMKKYNITQLLVLNTKQQYVGIIHLHDILKHNLF